MTDKVQKIREEVEGRMNCFKNERNTLLKASDNNLSLGARIAMCEEILSFIDSLQEEPAPKILEDMLNAKTPAESLGISQEEHDKIIDLCLYGSEVELVDVDDLPNKEEEPVSEDLEEAATEICSKVLKGETITIDGYEYVVLSDAEECFKAGAKWQFKNLMNKVMDWLPNAERYVHINVDNNGGVHTACYTDKMISDFCEVMRKDIDDEYT